MSKTSGFIKSGVLALALAGVLPVAAQASQLANDPSFISEVNAAYGTNFQSQASQGRASNPVQQDGPQAPAQLQN